MVSFGWAEIIGQTLLAIAIGGWIGWSGRYDRRGLGFFIEGIIYTELWIFVLIISHALDGSAESRVWSIISHAILFPFYVLTGGVTAYLISRWREGQK